MRKFFSAGAAVLALGLAACGEQPTDTRGSANSMEARPAGAPAEISYSATGEVKEVSAERVTIAHGPVAELEWPAMTMMFSAEGTMLQDVKPGDQVSFTFRQSDSGYALTSLTRN